jgi:hypothetical protein
MALEDIIKFQLKKVNPFQGLIIDADTWRDAHNYHRDQLRLHTLAFHKTGIVAGLNVTASNPPDLSVTVYPGMGVDPEGNVVIVSQKQRYRLQTQKTGLVYLVLQFREVPSEPYQPPNGGQPTRILEAYRIEERDKLPAEPHLELARIDFDPARGKIEDARLTTAPARNEIDLRFRQEMAAPVAETQKVTTVIKEVPVRETPSQPAETITLGHAVLGTASKDLHVTGLKNLVRELGRQGNLAANLEESIPLDKDLKRYTLVYLTGCGQFELAAEQQASINRFLQSGGIIFGEGCTDGEGQTRGAREFGLAFNQLANQLKRKLEIVKRGHPLLSVLYVFSDVPQGAEPGMLLEGGRIIYSGSDYGCAWQGGHQSQSLSRDIIRSSFEMGVNMAVYAQMMKATGR